MGGSQSVEALTKQLAEGQTEQQEAAVKGILALAGADPEKRKAIGRTGCIPKLIGILSMNAASDKSKELAAAALGHLAIDSENKASISEANGILPLVKLATDGSVGCKAAAATALSSLASKAPDNQAKIAKAGGIQALVKLLECGDANPQARAWAAAGLGNLAALPENQTMMAKSGCVGALVQLLVFLIPQGAAASPMLERLGVHCRRRKPAGTMDGEWIDKGKEWVTKALSAVAYNHAENQALIVDAGGAEPLLELLMTGVPRVQLEAIKALCNLVSKCETNKAKLIELGLPKALVRQIELMKGLKESKEFAAGLLGALASGHPPNQKAIAEAGAVSALVWLLHMGSLTAKVRSAAALCSLAQGNRENKSQIGEAGGIEPLLRLTEVAPPSLKIWAAKALCSIVEGHDANRGRLESMGIEDISQLEGIAAGNESYSDGGMRITPVHEGSTPESKKDC